MSEMQPKARLFALLPLLLLAGGMAFNAFADPLPLPPGPLNTNLFNTNGLVVPPDVRFLLQDLQTNLNQLQPFLAVINGEPLTNSVTNDITSANRDEPPANTHAVPDEQGSARSNGIPLVYGLGAALENVQTDLQELLPRLAAMAGHTNYSNPLSTNHPAVPNRFETTNSPAHPSKIQRASASMNTPRSMKPGPSTLLFN